MSNINLAGDQLFNLNGPIEPGAIVGSGETYANVAAVPAGLKYPGKRIYDKDTGITYVIGTDGSTAESQNKPDIISNSFTGIHVLTQAEYDALTPVSTILYIIKETQEEA